MLVICALNYLPSWHSRLRGVTWVRSLEQVVGELGSAPCRDRVSSTRPIKLNLCLSLGTWKCCVQVLGKFWVQMICVVQTWNHSHLNSDLDSGPSPDMRDPLKHFWLKKQRFQLVLCKEFRSMWGSCILIRTSLLFAPLSLAPNRAFTLKIRWNTECWIGDS